MSVEAVERTSTGGLKVRRTDQVLYAWAERIERVAPEYESFEVSSMICRGDSLYHYGTHFELARIIRDKRGRTRLVLMNGDSYEGASGFGPSTGSRQSDVRRVVGYSDVPGLVVPFSALEGAGIDFDSIMPVHVRADRQTTEEHSSRQRPAKLVDMDEPNGQTTVETYMGYGEHGTDDCGYRERTRVVPVRVPNPNRTQSFSSGHGWCMDGAARDEDGVWRWQVRRHWLGDSLFRARCTEQRTRKATAIEIEQHEQHLVWLGEHKRLEDIESDMRRKSWSVDDRYGYAGDYRQMTRCMMASAGFAEQASRAAEVVYEHGRSRVEGVGMLPGNRMRRTVTRWGTYLSSFDYQETRPLYFLCELPNRARPSTVDEAIQDLKPPEVVAAEARGIKVIRQGDLFAIPTKLNKRQIRRMRGRMDFTKRLRVLGTNHSVSEGIVVKGGATLGRGVMRHEPEAWRPPDHKSVNIGKVWHMLVRNTVPRTH